MAAYKNKSYTPQELGHIRPWKLHPCKFCSTKVETRAVWHFTCPECGKVTWLKRRKY